MSEFPSSDSKVKSLRDYDWMLIQISMNIITITNGLRTTNLSKYKFHRLITRHTDTNMRVTMSVKKS